MFYKKHFLYKYWCPLNERFLNTYPFSLQQIIYQSIKRRKTVYKINIIPIFLSTLLFTLTFVTCNIFFFFFF